MPLVLKDALVPGRLSATSATLSRGVLLHLLGPNGAGKSTLLAAMAGLQPVQGEIWLEGRQLKQWSGAELAKVRAWLPQQQPAPSSMPVYHYLQLHQQFSGVAQSAQLETLLKRLQLHDKLARNITQLSGGEWQRVRLAAVLLQCDPVCNPAGKLLIMDEPLTGLDIAQQKMMDTVIKSLCEQGVTVITSGHDLNHSLHHADEVWLMGEGKIIAQGTPHQVMTPARLSRLYGLAFRLVEFEQQPWLLSTV